MPKTGPPYPAVFRRQVVELVRAERTPEDLARESSRRPRPSGTGSRRRVEMRASAPTACVGRNVKSFAGCGGRIGGCATNAKFWQGYHVYHTRSLETRLR